MQEHEAENELRRGQTDAETRAFSKRLNAAKAQWRAEYERQLLKRLPQDAAKALRALIAAEDGAAAAARADEACVPKPEAADAGGAVGASEPGADINEAHADQAGADGAKAADAGATEPDAPAADALGAPADSATLALLRELADYRDRDEDARLAQDARRGAIYCSLRGEVQRLADYARGHGSEMSLSTAFNAVLLEHLDELLQEAAAKSAREAAVHYRDNAWATPAALGSETAHAQADYGAMSDEEFGRVLQKALNGELRRSGTQTENEKRSN